MQVTKQDIDTLNTRITVVIEQADYKDKFESTLQKQRQKTELKGFRKGKTPLSMVKKLYGEQALAEAVNDKLQGALYEFITEEKLEVLGDPIPTENHEQIQFDPNNMSDYTFTFDAGLAPAFDLKGASENDSYTKCDIAIDDKVVEDELMAGQKRMGTQESVDSDIEEKDILTVKAIELENAKPKAKGFETEFKIMTELIADDTLRKSVLKMKKGGKFSFDIYKLEKDKDETHVRKYLLNLDEDEEREIGNDFEGTIADVSRLKPAEMNDEFIQKYFNNEEIKTVEDGKKKIKEDIGKYYDEQASKLMYRDIMDALIEKNPMEMPEEFLKRWLKLSNDKVTDESLEKEFPDFVKNLKWTLIKNKLAKDADVKVEADEIKNAMTARVHSYLGQYNMGAEYVDNMVQKLMQDREQVNKLYEEIHADKVFKALEEKIKIKKDKVSLEQFQEKVQTLNAKLKGG